MRTAATDPAKRAEALRLAREHGPAEAARRTGIPGSTIRVWICRENTSVTTLRPDSDPDRLRKTSKHARKVVTQAIGRLEQLIPDAKNPQQIAIAAGILCDKAAQVEQVVEAMEERELRLSAALGQQLAAIIELAFGAINIELTPGVRAVLSDLLRRSRNGGPLTVSPALAAAAALDVKRQLATPSTATEQPTPALTAPPQQTPDPSLDPTSDDVDRPYNPPYDPHNPLSPAEPDAPEKEAAIVDAEVVEDDEPATTLVRSHLAGPAAAIPRMTSVTTRTPAPASRWPGSRNVQL
jgi:hypothetical protein